MKKTKLVNENRIEQTLVERVHALGGLCEKVTVIGKRGFCDRLIILQNGRVIFAEIKRPRGGRVSPHQKKYANDLGSLGAEVALIRAIEDIDNLLR
jgi:hypothetical protein